MKAEEIELQILGLSYTVEDSLGNKKSIIDTKDAIEIIKELSSDGESENIKMLMELDEALCTKLGAKYNKTNSMKGVKMFLKSREQKKISSESIKNEKV